MKIQEQTATGSRINRASDDPSAAYRVLGLSSRNNSLSNYIDILNQASDATELANSMVQDVSDSMVEARLLISQVTSGTYDDMSRQRTAEALNDILEQVLFLGNTKNGDQYIFGGNNSSSASYVSTKINGQITSVDYRGSDEARIVGVAPEVNMQMYYCGDEIFRMDNRGEPVFEGTTGVSGGTGTSSARGFTWLTVEDDGAGSYKLSIDDGLTYTSVPAGGLTNQAVTDSRTGEILYVDSTQITATGVELVEIPQTADIFDTLIMVRDIFANERNLSESQIKSLQGRAISSIDTITDYLVQKNVVIGSRVGFLENLQGNLEDLKFNNETESAGLEEADLAQLAINLSQREVLYQMSLSVAGNIMSMSLLDFIG
jgi:flagellar hook-associated protein 3 FlgL